MKKEKWLPVVGYEGLYEVSDQGRVRSLLRRDRKNRHVHGRVLKPRSTTNTSGNKYLRVQLCLDGTNRDYYIHALVLESFVGARPQGCVAAHEDNDGTNNTPSNLSWKTQQGNADDRVRHGNTTKGEKNPMARLTAQDAVRIRDLAVQGYSQSVIAKQVGTVQAQVWRIIHKKQWAHV